MLEVSCFGILKRISSAVGHSQLGETYLDVRKAMDTNAVALIDMSVRLDNVGVPDAQLDELTKLFKGNVFCQRLLRQLVVQHFYLFPSSEATKQRVCQLLNIPIKVVQSLEVTAVPQRLAPGNR